MEMMGIEYWITVGVWGSLIIFELAKAVLRLFRDWEIVPKKSKDRKDSK